MNSFGLDICEVCGTQTANHAGWFAIAGNGASMEVLPWTDDVRGRADCRHACCGEHAEKLVLSTATHELAGTTFLSRRWNPEALLPPGTAEIDGNVSEESLMSILSAVESILQSPDEDESAPAAFDA